MIETGALVERQGDALLIKLAADLGANPTPSKWTVVLNELEVLLPHLLTQNLWVNTLEHMREVLTRSVGNYMFAELVNDGTFQEALLNKCALLERLLCTTPRALIPLMDASAGNNIQANR